MFSELRLRLTGLYLLAALALLGLVGGGTYAILRGYFVTTTDLALQHTMAHEFRRRGVPVPAELAAADRDWAARRTPARPAPTPTRRAHDEGEEEHAEEREPARPPEMIAGTDEEAGYDGELAAIFMLPLDAAGRLVTLPGDPVPALAPDLAAVAGALARGRDLRTVEQGAGARVRLLTYRLPAGSSPAVLQAGRPLDDQDRALDQLLLGLLGLGAVSACSLGIAGWVLAGRALRPAQEAWARQQAFVANASHELRTPLTLIRASTEVARRGLPPAEADQQALLDDVLQDVDYMSRLVEDLLLLSRLDAGRLALERRAVPLPDLLGEVARQVGRVAAAREVRVAVAAASGAAWADPIRLRQVLLILLDNALRHTPAGGSIHLTAQPHGGHITIGVADTGEGIAPEHLPHLFERFYRAAVPPSSGGAGLGLALAKGLVEAQHGRIAIASRPGAGTQVTLTLPAAPA